MKSTMTLMSMLALLATPALAAAAPAAKAPATAVSSLAPADLVHDRTQEILALIRAHQAQYRKDPAKLYTMVDTQVLPYFDFETMSRWVLGRYWRTATPAQQSEFVAQFRNLLVRTYATALLNYQGQTIRYLPLAGKPSDQTALVRTLIVQNNGSPDVPVDYSFYHEPSGWKVYDVSIDRVSLVTNYRGTYATQIQRSGLDSLIASLTKASALPARGRH